MVSESLEDEQITDREMSDVDAQLRKLINQANSLRAHLVRMNERLHDKRPVSMLQKV